jgi:hypothetical protein
VTRLRASRGAPQRSHVLAASGLWARHHLQATRSSVTLIGGDGSRRGTASTGQVDRSDVCGLKVRPGILVGPVYTGAASLSGRGHPERRDRRIPSVGTGASRALGPSHPERRDRLRRPVPVGPDQAGVERSVTTDSRFAVS